MTNTPDYITPDGEELYYHELEGRTEETLDECYEPLTVGYMTFDAGRVVREMDPIAFRECVMEEVNAQMNDGELDEWREGHPWSIEAADNAPEGAVDVWLRFDKEDDEESEAEANVFTDDPDHFRVEWYLTAVGLVTRVYFETYDKAREWLEAEGFEDFSA